uniref:TF_AP-2 domain-containing protein n=1 Tax=Caenorhabditis japonica TaxID=281687 RepID=A0A8R1ECC3_CAEJA
MTDSGLTLNLCLKKLEWSQKALVTLVSIYEEIQPKVVGLEEKYRGCALDEKFAELSLATHGFLHPHSISSFQHVCKVLEIACQNAESVMNGTRTMRELEEVVDGEKPFQNMSDNAFMYWQGKPFGMISKRLEDEILIIENSLEDMSGE